MRDELKIIADIFYAKIVEPSHHLNINWLRKEFLNLGIKDENIEHLYILNAPLSREVWYYTLLKMYEEKKLDAFLNAVQERIGVVDLGTAEQYLESLGLCHKDGKFKLKTFNIAVLVSGRGTNLQAIIDAINNGKINGKIVVVISNKKNALALKRAEMAGIETFYVPSKKGIERENYDRQLAEIIDSKNVQLIVLAGFMRILSPWFVKKYKNKIINIHPSLLPSFAGLHGDGVHRAVLEYGAKVSGCTVHFVTEEVDNGPIIVQRCVEVKDNDTPETLAERVLTEEHIAIVEAIKMISEGAITLKGRRVVRKNIDYVEK